MYSKTIVQGVEKIYAIIQIELSYTRKSSWETDMKGICQSEVLVCKF